MASLPNYALSRYSFSMLRHVAVILFFSVLMSIGVYFENEAITLFVGVVTSQVMQIFSEYYQTVQSFGLSRDLLTKRLINFLRTSVAPHLNLNYYRDFVKVLKELASPLPTTVPSPKPAPHKVVATQHAVDTLHDVTKFARAVDSSRDLRLLLSFLTTKDDLRLIEGLLRENAKLRQELLLLPNRVSNISMLDVYINVMRGVTIVDKNTLRTPVGFQLDPYYVELAARRYSHAAAVPLAQLRYTAHTISVNFQPLLFKPAEVFHQPRVAPSKYKVDLT